MSDIEQNEEDRLTSLEEEIKNLKRTLGAFAIGLDKVSQTQANQTIIIEGLVNANEIQAQYLKRLVDNTEKHNELLKKFLENKND